MSEPVSTAEIEDVLSSIRRLVTENANVIKREEPKAEGPAKLVLTPAFRVDGPAGGAKNGQVVEVDAASWGGGSGSRVSADEARFEAIDDTQKVDSAKLKTPAVETPLERRIAELEAAVASSATEFEPDGSEAADIPHAFVFQHEDAMAERELEPASEPVAEAELPVEEASVDEASLDEAQDWEDVASETVAADTICTADEAENDEADLIDEDTLREMVARMVREELQGTVGERITHNVRRLVRREIARALALQDFE